MGALKYQKLDADPGRLSVRYGGVPVIYVESEEDRHVFGDCWFRDRLAQVEFRPASSIATSSGCNGVILAVRNELQAGNAAWGIVDRDVAMSQDFWQIVNETDDAVYENHKPFGEKIKMLIRWEIENYLVDGEALEFYRSGNESRAARPLDIVHNELLEHCQTLVPHAAFNALSHQYRGRGLGDGYANRFTSRGQVESDIAITHLPKLPTAAAVDYPQKVTEVEAFDNPSATTLDRINGLLRRLHGKAVLERFRYVHRINFNLDGFLAKRIEEKNRVPGELTRFVDQVVATT